MTLNNWLILLCCAVLITASLLTSGLTRALIDLAAFICLLGLLVWRHSGRNKKQCQ